MALSTISPFPAPVSPMAGLCVCRSCGYFDPLPGSGLCESCEGAALDAARYFEQLEAERDELMVRALEGPENGCPMTREESDRLDFVLEAIRRETGR